MFIAATGVPEPEARLIMIKKVLSFLPPTNYKLLKRLCQYLKKLTENKDENKMSPENVAICFAPNLLRADTTDLKLMLNNQSMGKDVMISLIDKFDYFFSEDIVYKEEVIKKYKPEKELKEEKKEMTLEEKQALNRKNLLKKSQITINNIDMQSIVDEDIKKFDQSLLDLDRLVSNDVTHEKPLIKVPSEHKIPLPPPPKRMSSGGDLKKAPQPPEKRMSTNYSVPNKAPPQPPKLPDLPTPPTGPKPKIQALSPRDNKTVQKESPKVLLLPEVPKRKATVLPDIPQKKSE